MSCRKSKLDYFDEGFSDALRGYHVNPYSRKHYQGRAWSDGQKAAKQWKSDLQFSIGCPYRKISDECLVTKKSCDLKTCAIYYWAKRRSDDL